MAAMTVPKALSTSPDWMVNSSSKHSYSSGAKRREKMPCKSDLKISWALSAVAWPSYSAAYPPMWQPSFFLLICTRPTPAVIRSPFTPCMVLMMASITAPCLKKA
ncbi:hypothetical protein Mapa_005172 [Marchantia paleacea]|nr:hypothetical protein Mapa_005172 [Marchantia paleacea]